MSELTWWRHGAIWVDITLGAAILLFALWAALRVRRAAGLAGRRDLGDASRP
jgi:hypothetical protein